MKKTAKSCNWHTVSTVSFIVISMIASPVIQYTTQDYVTFTVDKAERVSDGTFSRYLVFTKDETFENTDSIAFFKFNSSDLYGQINGGKIYKAKVAGVRIPFLSKYRNIIEIQEESK